LRDKWKRDGVKPATIRRRMALISHLFTIASREWGMAGLVNPVHGVAFESASDARSRRVSDEELAAICRASESQELAAFVRMAVATGMRRGELVSLQWRNIDLKNRVARVLTKSKVKGRMRDVPLSQAAVKILRTLPHRIDGQVFAGKADTFTQAFVRSVQRARKQYLEECKKSRRRPDEQFLVDVRLHDLRHESASRFAQVLQAHELARVMGHATMQMLMRYYNPTAKELAAKLA
jgi:integrase